MLNSPSFVLYILTSSQLCLTCPYQRVRTDCECFTRLVPSLSSLVSDAGGRIQVSMWSELILPPPPPFCQHLDIVECRLKYCTVGGGVSRCVVQEVHCTAYLGRYSSLYPYNQTLLCCSVHIYVDSLFNASLPRSGSL